MQCTESIVALFDTLYNEKTCQEIARECRFVQRASSKLKGHELIKVLTIPNIGVSEASLNGLCVRLKEFNPDADISASALVQRINTPAAAEMMKTCFQRILQLAREKAARHFTRSEGVLSNFKNVYIQDSTVCELNEKLQKIYKGTDRGGGCKSQVKIDLIHNFTTGLIHDAKICAGNVPDQGLSRRIIDLIDAGDLVIRDLGYFALNILRQIAEKDAYYLTRLPPHLKVYLHVNDTRPVELAKYIDKHFSNGSVIDMAVYIGDERLPTRLIAYRMPDDVVRERLRRAYQRAKDASRVLSDAKRNLLRFTLFITNVPEEILPPKIVGTIYRLRWEIELIFKQWKGLLKIDVLRGVSRHRIDCLLWGRLCMVVIVALITGHFMKIVSGSCCPELSPVKLIDYLMMESKLSRAVGAHRIEELLKELMEVMSRRLVKDKRARTTMRERVIGLEAYYGCCDCS